jgi:translocation and assembly module TamB
VRWQNARFTIDLRAIGRPAENQSAPPLNVDIAGQGDTESFQIERFNISLPGTTAHLLAPIIIDREAQILSGPSQFSLESDLEQLPGNPELRGKITGRVRVQPDGENLPRLTAELEARDVRAAGFDVKVAVFEAEQVGAKLAVKKSSIAFADGSNADVKGDWDWSTRTVTDASLDGEIKAAAFARVLPPTLTFSRFSVSAKAAGRWPDLSHSGKLDVDGLTVGTPKPVEIEASWKGTGPSADSFELEAKTGASTISMEGQLTRDNVQIDVATLTLPDAPKLQLAQPTVVRWRPALSIENLDFVGNATVVRATWSGPGARLEIQNIESTWLQDLAPVTSPPWKLESLTFQGSWPSGVLTGDARINGQVAIGENKNARIELIARAQPDGVMIERLVVNGDEGPVLHAHGRAPYVITPTAQPVWKFSENGSWSLQAETAPDSPFWKAQAAATGVTLTAPRLIAKIEGSPKKPDAYIDLQAEEITFQRVRLPTLSKFGARLVLEETRISLERFSILSAGQTLTASGHTSIKPEQWKELSNNPRLLWSGDAQARLHLPAIDLSAFATFLPEALAPTGVLDGNITVKADGTINGAIKVTDASTHPISPFGSFNQISSEIIFDGRKATLKSLTALASGQPVEAKGAVEFPANAPLKLDLTLVGKNLPLARQTGLLLRGDINLQLKSSAEGITTVGGDVNLHDGIFLRDVRSLVPKRGGGAASRPPYFSVTKAPFRDWQLALKVGGERFIQLRTPLFNGVVSGSFQLSGTLFEPIAIGQATFDEGVVLLPFASLRLKSGSVRLTQADPYTPQLAINAESRTLGYDVRMDLSGPASDPVLVFSSSPPLSSEQVLLMVMAGETPRSDISYSGSERATRIGTYLGKSLFSGLFGGSGGAERLTISSGENVTEAGEETYSVEYMLNKRWSVVGERDEFDDYNIGFKRRLLTKKKKDADAATR